MYHAIVLRKIRKTFEEVSRGNAEPVLAAFTPSFEHRFLGEDHALGGSRTSLAQTRKWYERLYRLLPDISFELLNIHVAGPPWRTTVIVDWLETNSGTDGVRTENRGVHVVHLRWGKVTRVIICPHTSSLIATLDRLHAAGNPEAHAEPILG
jgi:ketosteroid isomerase-like protein